MDHSKRPAPTAVAQAPSKRPAPAPPQQAAPSPTGMTVAAYANRDPRRADREREKLKQRQMASQVAEGVPLCLRRCLGDTGVAECVPLCLRRCLGRPIRPPLPQLPDATRAQVIKTRMSASYDVYEWAGSDTLQIVPTLPGHK